jgi:TonB-linked SusC/RagA family outer membrane protein
MKKILLTCFALAFVLSAWAQERIITGKVTSAEDGSPLPGVNIVLKGTTTGATTDADGTYSIATSADGILVFSFIGFKTSEIQVGTRTTVDVPLSVDFTQLTEVVVTGVGAATSTKKLTISVGKVNEELIQQVPGMSAASALQSKIAGVRVTSGGGAPGSSPDIKLRAAGTISGSQSPLIIIDGIISENGLESINSNDIETIEVVKGAASSSLYGSRAANGVVNIITKRGSHLKAGDTEVVIRSEYGVSQLPRTIPINRAHNRFVPEGQVLDYGVHGTATTDQIFDERFATFNNYQEDLFDPGSFYSNYIRVGSRTENTNFSVSVEDQKQGGVIFLSDGFRRQTARFNADHYAFKNKLVINASAFLSKTENDVIPTGDGSVLFDLVKLPPNQNVFDVNEEDGSPYKWRLNPSDPDAINPLYAIGNREITDITKRNMLNIGATYSFTSWLKLEAAYGRDDSEFDRKDFNDKNWLPQNSGARTTGQLSRQKTSIVGETFRANLFFDKKFGDVTTGVRLSYLKEDYVRDNFGFTGNNPTFPGLSDPDALQQAGPTTAFDYPFSLFGSGETRRAENYFAVANVDYKDKYLVDLLVRRDGSSLFGENERFATFYRMSGAWRISEDIAIPEVQELKLRVAYGTAGNRPPFIAQYERYGINGTKLQTGNKDLKREISKELEFGLNASFLDRFTLEVNYATTNTEDLILELPLPLSIGGGYSAKFENAGNMKSKVLEVALNASVVKNKAFSWSVGIVFDRIRTEVTDLKPNFIRVGPTPNSNAGQGLFYITEGHVYGEMWGNVLMTSVDQLQPNQDPNNYVINSDGYLVLKSQIGTTQEVPIRALNASGQPLYAKIGDANPDFNMGLNSTFSWKGLSLYALLDWKQGGDVYNQTKQWMFFNAGTHGDMDMSEVVQERKKSGAYYQNGLYNANNPVDFFVEDGSWIKLREVALTYTLNKNSLSKAGINFLREIKVGILGRNLWMTTPYSGYDPEVARTGVQTSNNDGGGNAALFAYDGFNYPNFRTYTGSITVTF